MIVNKLTNLSLLSGVIAKPLSSRLLNLSDEQTKNNSISGNLVNIYAAFLFSQGHQNFNGTSILNNKGNLQRHIDELIGFIFEESQNLAYVSKSSYARVIHNMICKLAKYNNINLATQSFSNMKVNGYVQHCIESYKKLPVDNERLTYLNGWELISQENKSIPVNLDFMYVNYGRSFTEKIHSALSYFGLTQKKITLENRIYNFIPFLEMITSLDKERTIQFLEHSLNASNVQSTFLKVYHCMLSDCIVKNNSITTFNSTYTHSLDTYKKVFIDTKIYPEPLIPFVVPSIRKVSALPSFSSGGNPSDTETIRWFADIPLYIKDDEAIDIIESRLSRDMDYLKFTLTSHYNELKAKQERNNAFIKSGWVKPLAGNRGAPKGKFSGGTVAKEIGPNHLENTVATFYHYGINGYNGTSYSDFLGYKGCSDNLEKELNLPNYSTLFTLTLLLVIEHPKITPAWLRKIKLFNENGKLSGYKQVGDLYILTSEKERRGRSLAQQDVILNDFSKSIVDFLIEHTKPARQHLRSIGNPDWKYFLITCSINKATKPATDDTLYKPKRTTTDLLNNKDYSPSEHDLTQNDLDIIARITTHRSIRRHRGLQIYLKTRSQSAVADALGHKKVNNLLLVSYLPKPLVVFFTERVIRQFQKAIVLKAMEDSPLLLDAMNMTYDEIKEFFENHGLNEMPDLSAETFDGVASNEGEILFDRVIFTITVPVIQILISIKTIVDSNNNDSNFSDLVKHWYQSACYLLNRFALGDFAGNDDIKEMYEVAKGEPLNHNVIKGAISC